MKILISENQYKRLFEQEQEVFHIPSLKLFNNDWNTLQMFLNKKGNPPYSIGDDLDLRGTTIQSLGNLKSVGGYLDLQGTKIKSLGNLQSVGGGLSLVGTPIQSLGNLESVVGGLFLQNSKIQSLGNLKSVGGDLFLENTPISKKYTREQIRQMINVKGYIYM
jgi:hypothetical protein